MAGYTIPKDYLSGFDVINELPKETIENISESLLEIKPGQRREAFVDALSKHIPNSHQLEMVAASIFSMGKLITAEEASLDRIAEGLANAFFRQTSRNESKEKIEELSQKILQLVSSWRSAKQTFKALRLSGHSERLYRSGSIVSDIRLVFNDDIANRQRQGLILHQLKLDYIVDDNVMKEFYVTLDNQDLQKLKEQINRAIEKEQKIREDYTEIDFITLQD